MNALGGLMSAYFVVTALTTVRRTSAWTHPLNVAALVVGVGLTLLYATLGVKALSVPDRAIDGVPVFMFFFMGTITALAVGGDIRLWLSGSLPASRRLARHLWRMCFALFIAAGSFFSVRERVAKILPQQFATPAMRALPVALVFVAMFYWLWRTRFRRLLPQAR